MEAALEFSLARKQASMSDAKLAYFGGDFDRCLEICATIPVGTLTTASEVALIMARAHLRSGRPHEAQVVLAGARNSHTTLDACLTSQMLEATALIRQDGVDSGIAMLLDAASVSASAHFAIRSEIAFCTALGYWAKREIDVAESYLKLVDSRADIIHARALELQAWCHTARRDYRRAAEFFRSTLLRLDNCQAGDRAIAATAISTLAIFAAELFDRDIARFVEMRSQCVGWSAGLSAHRYVTLEHQALFAEFNGNTIDAYHYALQAQESASTVPDQVSGWVLKSAIARNAGEVFSAVVAAQRAQRLLATLDPNMLEGEDRFALLGVAEICADFDPGKSSELFGAYCALSPIDPMVSSSGDPRRAAYETFIAGVIAQARDERDQAQFCYRKAFECFRDIGYVRRAVIAANALVRIVGDDSARSYIATHLRGVSNYIADVSNSVADDQMLSLERHPRIAALPRTQREVVILLCLGKSNKEIAELRRVGEQSIKNILTKSVFPAFGVSSRAALMSLFLSDRRATGNQPNTLQVRVSM